MKMTTKYIRVCMDGTELGYKYTFLRCMDSVLEDLIDVWLK